MIPSRPLQIAAALLAVPVLALSAPAAAQAPGPLCQRLEAQLAALDRGGDTGRADQLRRYDEALNRQQFELDKLNAQARQLDCGSSGFFSIFQTPSPRCTALTRQIEQMRANIDRMRGEMQQLDGNLDRAGQRSALLRALGDNDCGPQYRSAAGPRTLFDSLFGNSASSGPSFSSSGDAAGSTFRTICVRTCDGYYYPISFATTPNRFREDEQVCQRTCPAAQVTLYTYRNPGEDVAQAVSLAGDSYSSLPTAFRYRQHYDAACSCRQTGQSWADALKQINDATVEQGDIVVTQERARQMALPRDARGRPVRDPASRPPVPEAAPQPQTATADPARSAPRSVGPQFIPSR